jgi:arginyl-tRNA synthetase
MLPSLEKKQTIIDVLKSELIKIITSKSIAYNFVIDYSNLNIEVERSKLPEHGDYFTNVAITLFPNKEKRILFAQSVASLLPLKIVEMYEIMPNGFINMYINKKYLFSLVKEILIQKNKYGQFPKKREFYDFEFVSANPTGLLHIGHARNAAIGDSLNNV